VALLASAAVSTVNAAAREVQAKIVYYGPGLSGKTTSLRAVHAAVRPETRGQLVSLATEGDRTLFFDFLPLHVEQVNGFALRLQLYTVPGQVFYEATRKLVLNGADGVVFVADSQPAALDADLESLASLERNLVELGHDPAAFPLVIQWNKRDLPGVLSPAELRTALNPRGAPEFPTVASRGEGIMEALKEITRLSVASLRARPGRVEASAASASDGGSVLERRISAMAEGRPLLTPEPTQSPFLAAVPGKKAPAPAVTPAVTTVSRVPVRGPLSFARLFPGGAAGVVEVEQAIRDGRYDPAVKAAAQAVAAVLAGLELEERSDSARAALLGLDGREYLRLLRLARLPEGMASEIDALFALHVLVSARLRADGI
jgi:signal recognition particle receptor subunit beta